MAFDDSYETIIGVIAKLDGKYTAEQLRRDLKLTMDLTEQQAVDIIKYILTDDRGSSEGNSNIDYILDYRYIYPSLKQIYGVDLNRDDITWWEYLTMLEGCFSQDCILSSVVGIRDMDIAQIKDADQKVKVLDMKAKYRLHKNETQDSGLGKVFGMLKGVAESGS